MLSRKDRKYIRSRRMITINIHYWLKTSGKSTPVHMVDRQKLQTKTSACKSKEVSFLDFSVQTEQEKLHLSLKSQVCIQPQKVMLGSVDSVSKTNLRSSNFKLVYAHNLTYYGIS